MNLEEAKTIQNLVNHAYVFKILSFSTYEMSQPQNKNLENSTTCTHECTSPI